MALVHYTRGGHIESSHCVQAVATDRAGRLLFSAGWPHLRTFWRSGAKPFQLIPFVAGGGVERFGLTDRELAVMASSHSGDDFHVELVQSILAKLGLSPADLECGAAQPLDAAIAREMYKNGSPYAPLHNDCSGKHAGMLGLALLIGAPLAGYVRPDHPVQQAARTAVARATDLPAAAIEEGVDGCGVPTFRLPLFAMALAYARLGTPVAADWGEWQPHVARIRDAMRLAPDCVGGRGRLETALMEVTHGRLVAKLGAEAGFCLACCDSGQGLAYKVRDGGQRALAPFGLAVLSQLGWLSAAEAAELHKRFPATITNDRGETVGAAEVQWD
jgi:L-asparaginase II